jgi:hypothetical protein
MRRALGWSLLFVALLAPSAAHADVVVPDVPVVEEPAPAADPAPRGGRGSVHQPMVRGLIAMLFLVMGAVAANDRHKKAAASSRRV